ncbi:MAG TPA: DNA recombination protein RmuC [Acidobacteriaceae bacterium]|jgi:DNA recombination protein RmuC|nr:DNA recombination protein RmuC [Acidobacteriaceae bacterium]
MTISIFALLIAILVLLIVLLMRRSAPGQSGQLDPRLAQLPEAIARLEGQAGATNKNLNDSLSSMRTEASESAQQMRTALNERLDALTQRLIASAGEAAKQQTDLRESLNQKFSDLSTSNAQSLAKMSADNEKRLEQMRETVDEKLQKTLQTRLTESFGMVTDQLGKVQTGLGEMKELATGVGDLKRVLSNVKARGVVGEFLLGQQIEQMFSPEQYVKNARIKPGTLETVEYALKFPNGDGDPLLLAIDSKFPQEDWERLEQAYDSAQPEEIAKAGAAFERAIRTEGKRICDKYIDPPATLPHAIMFLPTENLYAEVVRRPGLQSEIQSKCRVTIAGPSTFMAILTSFQMGFHTLAIQKKGDEVWRVLSSAKNEFEKFGGLMDKVEKQVGTVQNTLRDISGKTKTINRTLKDVGRLDAGEPAVLLGFEEIAEVAPLLAAESEEPE